MDSEDFLDDFLDDLSEEDKILDEDDMKDMRPWTSQEILLVTVVILGFLWTITLFT